MSVCYSQDNFCAWGFCKYTVAAESTFMQHSAHLSCSKPQAIPSRPVIFISIISEFQISVLCFSKQFLYMSYRLHSLSWNSQYSVLYKLNIFLILNIKESMKWTLR